jgi:hypothetical protein
MLARELGTGELHRQTLDGLLDWDTGRPRSIWHTWRAYADGRSGRVRSRSGDRRIAVVASGRSRHPGEAQLMLGNIGTARRQASVRLCALSALVRGHKRVTRAAVRFERHPDPEEAAFSPTLAVRVRRVRVEKDGGCAVGRIPLPREGGALVAYLRVR